MMKQGIQLQLDFMHKQVEQRRQKKRDEYEEDQGLLFVFVDKLSKIQHNN